MLGMGSGVTWRAFEGRGARVFGAAKVRAWPLRHSVATWGWRACETRGVRQLWESDWKEKFDMRGSYVSVPGEGEGIRRVRGAWEASVLGWFTWFELSGEG